MFNVNDNVFYNSPKYSWVLAQVKGVAPNPAHAKAAPGKRVTENFHDVIINDEKRKFKGDSVSQVADWDLEHADMTAIDKTVDDLLNLPSLHESTLLRCLYIRYMDDIIYTNIGAIVVALNPFNIKIPHYQDDKMEAYLAEAGQQTSDKLLPHSWAQAHNTYDELVKSRMNQCILISGESGAGKTEATKIVMKYLSKVSVLQGEGEEKSAAARVAMNLAACSPILESFGNAKTVRNDNSSRFGKLMRVKFEAPNYVLKGAFTTKYLLEKSRIITCSKDERIYHSFYLTARSKDRASKFGYDLDIKSYKSINSGGVLDNKEFSTAEDFEEVSEAMRTIGLEQATVDTIWQLASAVVHMCNVDFDADGEGSKLDDKTRSFLNSGCALWGLKVDEILEEFIAQKLVIQGTTTRKLQPKHKALDSKDAVSKSLYDRLFAWLVDQCNKTCDTPSDDVWIALLDIFGFEDFKLNSFEQLCINFTNETLQNHYNDYIFNKDMEQCRAEGIDTVDIVCPDNTPCLKLIKATIKLLDDQCAVGNGSSQKFLDNLNGAHGDDLFFMRKPLLKDSFCIRHYAGDVTYNTEGWIEKNRDTLREDIKALLRQSTVPLVGTLYQEEASSKPVTVGTFFKKQLQELMDVINSTNPHWIRCIKPHPAKKPLHFDGIYTMTQLDSSGVLGTVKIRKAGYPIRWKHPRFSSHYKPIVPLDSSVTSEKDLDVMDLKPHIGKILETAGYNDPKYGQIGKTLVFLKAHTFPLLEKKRNQALRNHAMLLQRCGRGLKHRRRFMKLKHTLVLQRAGRGILGRGQAFEVFCELNRERLLAMAKAREEERKLREEAERKMKEERLTLAKLETQTRQEIESQLWEEFSELHYEEQEQRQIAKDAVLAAQIAEQKRQEEERRRRLAEMAQERFSQQYSAMEPIMMNERREVERTEDELFEIVLFAEWKARLKAEFLDASKLLSAVENKRRLKMESYWNEQQEMFEERFVELKRRERITLLARDLRSTVQKNREEREALAEQRRHTARVAMRSYVEKTAVESVHEFRDFMALPVKPGEFDPSKVDPERMFDLILEKNLEEFSPPRYKRDVKADAVEQARRVQQAMEGPQNDINVSVSRAHVLEIGQVVYIPSKGCRGLVVEIVSTMSGQSARVRLDDRSHAWVEPDDVEIRRDGNLDLAPFESSKKQRLSSSPSRSPAKGSYGNSSANQSSSPYFMSWQMQKQQPAGGTYSNKPRVQEGEGEGVSSPPGSYQDDHSPFRSPF